MNLRMLLKQLKIDSLKFQKKFLKKIENREKTSFFVDDSSKIQLNFESEIVLKKSFIDELGFSNLKMNGFEPKYVIYNLVYVV